MAIVALAILAVVILIWLFARHPSKSEASSPRWADDSEEVTDDDENEYSDEQDDSEGEDEDFDEEDNYEEDDEEDEMDEEDEKLELKPSEFYLQEALQSYEDGYSEDGILAMMLYQEALRREQSQPASSSASSGT